MRKQSVLLVAIVFFILLLSVGYCVFVVDVNASKKAEQLVQYSQTIKTGDIDVIFYKIGEIEEFNSLNASAFISEGGKVLNLNIPVLEQVGAYAKFPITVKNVGSLPARLSYISQVNDTASIDIDYIGEIVLGSVIEPGEEKKVDIKVTYDNDKNRLESNFKIKLNYVQY